MCGYNAVQDGFCGHHKLVLEADKPDEKNYSHSRLIRINTTPEQLSVYRKVFGVARKMYNDGNSALKKKLVKLSEVRDYITRQSDNNDYCKAVPLKIRQGALEDLSKGYWSDEQFVRS
jgi:hypothetical protein